MVVRPVGSFRPKNTPADVGGEWCTWCHTFDRFVSSRPEVQNALKQHSIVVKVSYSAQNRNEQLLSRCTKATGYPHFYVLNGCGYVIASQSSAGLESGMDYDEVKVLAFLRRHRSAQ